jgi:hypothetical protein
MIMMPTTDPGHHCSSQARQTSGTPQGVWWLLGDGGLQVVLHGFGQTTATR